MACNDKIHSRGRVAFSRENVAPSHRRRDDDDPVQKQHRPPPCTSARKAGYIKLMKDGGVEDPFLVAYRDCTIDDDKKNYKWQKNKNGFGGRWRNLFGNLSCKQLTAVRDDSLISSPVSKPTVYKSF